LSHFGTSSLIEIDEMSTHDWMKSEYVAQGRGGPRQPAIARPTRTPLELALMGAGVLAWAWCAYEIVLLFLK
jgi:hypothetical protein